MASEPYTFSPWTTSADRRVVAPESAWRQVEALNEMAPQVAMMDYPPPPFVRPVVRIGVDLFEPFEGDVVDDGMSALFLTANGGWTTDEDDVPVVTTADILTRLFSLIDACPHLRFTTETQFPENVAGVMPKRLHNLTITGPDGRNVEVAE